jgi:hypothetical protein
VKSGWTFGGGEERERERERERVRGSGNRVQEWRVQSAECVRELESVSVRECLRVKRV